MTDINLTVLVGRLVRDAAISTNGSKVAYFKVASNRCYRDKNNAWRQDSAYVSCKAYGWWADAVSSRKKGEMVLVEGRLRTEERDSDEGKTRNELVLIVDSVRFISFDSPAKSAPPESNGSDVPAVSAASSHEVPF